MCIILPASTHNNLISSCCGVLAFFQAKRGKRAITFLRRHSDGEITALSHKCTHYGAPLSTGVLSNGRVRCPWHGACFNTKTGDIEDFPGLDSLQCFEVSATD